MQTLVLILVAWFVLETGEKEDPYLEYKMVVLLLFLAAHGAISGIF